MAQFYANENFPLGVVKVLRALGHDVLTSHDAGKANQSIPDQEVLAFATSQQRTLLTINWRDFIPLHQQEASHYGIVVCTQDGDIPGQAQRIHDAVTRLPGLAGQLVRVNRPQK